VSLGLSETYLPVIRTEVAPTGRLLRSIEDQISKFVKILRDLPRQHCFVYVNDGPSGVMRVADVEDSLGPGYPDAYRRALVHFTRLASARHHGFFFRPVDAPQALPAPENCDEENLFGA
jgi:hypothetical protein